MNLFKISWRNLWRNKRRTAITSSSILFAIFFVILMRSMQLGSYGHMIKSAIESYSGFLQIQHPDYQDDPSLENTIVCSDSLLQLIAKTEGIKAVVPRLEVFALASTGDQTKGVLVLGIDPNKENMLSDPESKLIRYRITKQNLANVKADPDIKDRIKNLSENFVNNSYTNIKNIAADFELDLKDDKNDINRLISLLSYPGRYLCDTCNEVLVSDRLSKYLNLDVNDTLILIGQGYQGATAAGLYQVAGIVKIANPELDNKLVYMPLHAAQNFSNLEKRVTTVAVNLHDNSDQGMLSMQEKLNKLTSDQMVVRNWKEFNKVLMQQIESDNQSGKIFMGFLYLIIFFGIFGTVLMMIHERQREFGVLISIGMKKLNLAVMLMLEMLIMGVIGIISGIILSAPFIYFYNKYPIKLTGNMARAMEDLGFDPIMPLEWFGNYILIQGFVVIIMLLLACIYPLMKVYKLKPINALRA